MTSTSKSCCSRSGGVRGFSLAEIAVVMVLLSVVALPLFLSSRASSDRLRSQGLARALTEELRAARAHAAQEQTDVVVAFPSGAGRSFRVYQGEDVLSAVRHLNFDRDYDSFILAATWPIEGMWQTASTLAGDRDFPAGMNLIVFGPDGSVTSNLPRAEGAYCLAVGGAMNFTSADTQSAKLEAIKDPSTVVIQPAGTIELVDRLYLASVALPVSEAKPVLASLEPDDLKGDHDPVVDSISFFPRPGSLEGESGIGKTFIEIHPVAKGGRVKEYGLVALEVEASDVDGGPLFLEVEVVPSSGRPGTLTSDGPVRMEYLQKRWQGTVGWRPPTDADPDTTYSFSVKVTDRDGRMASVAADASVLPVLSTLSDNRLAVESTAGVIYLANLQGGELVRLSPPGIQESRPLWSGDGTKLYALATQGQQMSFVRYNADGTGRTTITVFPEDAREFQVDGSGMYLGFLHATAKKSYRTLSEGVPEDSEVTTYSLSILHVSSGKEPLQVAAGVASFVFLPYENGQFQVTLVEVDKEEGPAFDEEGLPIDGELAEYAKLAKNSTILEASGLEPKLEKSTTSLAVSLARGAINPYEPRYFSGAPSSVQALAPGRSLKGSGVYVFQKRGSDWIDVAELTDGVKLLDSPAWSANGEVVVYTVEEKGVRKVYAQKVKLAPPEDKLEPIVYEPITMMSGKTVDSLVATPSGDAILYIEGTLGAEDSKLMSQRTRTGAKPVQIGVELPGVASYAITQ